jgi:hypothetical protein
MPILPKKICKCIRRQRFIFTFMLTEKILQTIIVCKYSMTDYNSWYFDITIITCIMIFLCIYNKYDKLCIHSCMLNWSYTCTYVMSYVFIDETEIKIYLCVYVSQKEFRVVYIIFDIYRLYNLHFILCHFIIAIKNIFDDLNNSL